MMEHANNKGFTVIELIMILLIIGLFIFGVVTYMTDLDKTALELASKKVAHDIAYIRNRALFTSKTHRIFLRVPDRIEAVYGNYTYVKNPDDNTDFKYNLSKKYSGVSFFRNYSLMFNSLGMQKFNAMTSITLTTGSKIKTIKILPNTGKIYVQ